MKNPNETDRMKGQIAVLESLSLMCAGILLAQAPNDPDRSKAVAIMNEVKRLAIQRGEETGCGIEAAVAADELLSLLSENLGVLRPRG